MSTATDSRTTAGPEAGDLVAEKYRIERVLGEGGMGRVYEAVNVTTGKHVALKWMLKSGAPHAMARFAREARAAGRIHHANVVDVYDVVEHGQAACLIMELLRGESLSELLDREKQLSIVEAVSIGIEAARGLAASHAEGVVHRDLKPANLFLCTGGGHSRVKVLDFGISKVTEPNAQSVTQTGAVVGTPQYMSPEQIRGIKDIDHRVDIYALGAVIYEMIAGRAPFENDHVTALLVEIATSEPVDLRTVRDDVPPELAAVVMRALAKSPKERFEDMTAFARALEPFGGGTKADSDTREWSQRVSTGERIGRAPSFDHASTIAATPQVSGTHSRPMPRRSKMRLWAPIAIAVLCAGVLVFWLTRTPAEPPAVEPRIAAPTRPLEEAAPEHEVARTVPAERTGALIEAAATSSAAAPQPAVADAPDTSRRRRRASKREPAQEAPAATSNSETPRRRAGNLSVEDF